MFKGNNTIRLNHSSMTDAVQMYFDSQFMPGKSPKVTSVRVEDQQFVIYTKEADAPSDPVSAAPAEGER